MKAISIVGLLLLAACSAEDNEGSGVPGSLLISQLNDKQRTAVCQAHIKYAYAHGSFEDSCTYSAVYETKSLTECKAYVDECVREAKAEFAAERRADLDYCTRLGGQTEYLYCEHTVAEYESCYKAEQAAYESAARESSCLRASEDGSGDDGDEYTSELCERVMSSCYIY